LYGLKQIGPLLEGHCQVICAAIDFVGGFALDNDGGLHHGKGKGLIERRLSLLPRQIRREQFVGVSDKAKIVCGKPPCCTRRKEADQQNESGAALAKFDEPDQECDQYDLQDNAGFAQIYRSQTRTIRSPRKVAGGLPRSIAENKLRRRSLWKTGMSGMIRVGVGGSTFEPWRGVFYPDGLPQIMN
jgi:hypothetical protein